MLTIFKDIFMYAVLCVLCVLGGERGTSVSCVGVSSIVGGHQNVRGNVPCQHEHQREVKGSCGEEGQC